MRTALSVVLGLSLALVSSTALAQGEPQGGAAGGGAGASGGAAAGGTVSGGATVTPPAPAPAPAPKPAAAAAEKEDDAVSDHDKFVGHFAIGYLGLTNLPIGGGAPIGVTQQTVPAPVIGVRYWLNHMIGIDGGLGFALSSSSSEVEQNNTTTSTDGPSILGGALHGGVPLALATGKHYTFEVIPEVNIGFTSRTDKQNGNPAPPDIHHSGFRLDVGARAGAEIHFGFIGVPELALQATVGLFFQHQVWHNSQDSGPGVPNPLSSSIGVNGIGTTVQSDPWALFVNNISALYYF